MVSLFDRLVEQKQADPEEKNTLAGDVWEAEEEVEEQLLPPGYIEARTQKRLREAVQEILRYGLLEQSHKPNLYRAALMDIATLNQILEPLDIHAVVDDIRGLIFLRIRHDQDAEVAGDDWTHPLVRKQRLNLEQSLLVAILRQYFVQHEQEAGTGAEQAWVAVDDLTAQMQIYLGDRGSEAKERNQLLQLLDQLKSHGLVSTPDTHDRVVIRPMIAHLANPENLQTLLHELKARVVSVSISEKEDA